MVLTKSELISTLQDEARILVHLAGKLDDSSIDYRPTPKQRSSLELLRYLSMMGPMIARAVAKGSFDGAEWARAEAEAATRDLAATVAVIAGLGEDYAAVLGTIPDAELRTEMELFGTTASKGVHLVTVILGGHAAYRTQLFVYLKLCGRTELSTYDLWAGMDAPAAA
jgi:hypothetical protein